MPMSLPPLWIMAGAGVGAVVIWKRRELGVYASLSKDLVVHMPTCLSGVRGIGELFSRLKTMVFIAWLESNHRGNIIEAEATYGAQAVAEDEGLLFQTGTLAHVRTAVDFSKAHARRAAANAPVLHDVVLIGGGHSHVHVLRMLGMEPEAGVRLTLISRDVMTPYSGMLPGHIAGWYTRDECHIDLVKMARHANARFVHASVTSIDRENRLIYCDDGRPPIRYDFASINIGCSPTFLGRSGYESVAEAREVGVTAVKPIDNFSARLDDILARVDDDTEIAIVGGGAAGAEVAMALRARLIKILGSSQGSKVAIKLIGRGEKLCPNHGPAVQKVMMQVVRERGIELHTGQEVVGVENSTLVTKKGDRIPFTEALWCTQGAAQQWLSECGLPVDEDGFIKTSTTLQTLGDPTIFAAGDTATIEGYKRPKSGVFAVFAGLTLARNVRLVARGEPLEHYYPQSEFLGIIGLGDGTAVASRGQLAWRTRWMWDLKDWIDRKWMWNYSLGLPDMPSDSIVPASAKVAGEDALELLKDDMRCGGCGSKVGATTLSNAMKRISIPTRPEIVVGAESVEDCAVVKVDRVLSCQTVDFFRAMISDPYNFGRIAANHSLSDMHAMGCQPVSALALVQLPHALPRIQEEDMVQMMSGACQALKESDCALVGGHTVEGIEPAMGFTITGHMDANESALLKSGMKSGQRILITKLVGTGTILAAEMRKKAHGVWFAGAVKSMVQSNGPAVTILRKHGVTACTDITGFGVAGHLLEMLKASEVSARLSIGSLPCLPGAVELVKRGIFSSLQPSNLRSRHLVFGKMDHEKYPLLFDPQTSGGVIASVPASSAAAAIKELRASGVDAQDIGEVFVDSEAYRIDLVDN